LDWTGLWRVPNLIVSETGAEVTMSPAGGNAVGPAPDLVHVKAKGAEVRSLYERGLTWVSFQPMPDLPCGIDVAIRKRPGFGVLSGTAQGVCHRLMREDVRDSEHHVSLHLNLSGLSVVAGRGREVPLGDGDAVLLSSMESRTISRPGPVYHRVVRLPRASLMPLVRDIDDAVLRPIPRGTSALNLLMRYAGALIDDPAVSEPELQPVIASQLCDLVAVTLGATRDAAAAAEGRGIRAARLRAVKSDIEAHLTDGRLSPTAVARRQRISDSYIRKLFEGEGTSFSEFVLARRLARAHRMLSDRRYLDRTIAAIAFEAGFGDVSYFNRTFKRLYGARPSETRRH
jgi:AraC-like DNA-binding protein